MVQPEGSAGALLSGFPAPVRPETEDLIRETIESWHGVQMTDFTAAHGASAALGISIIQVKVKGWTPALHAYTYTWQGEVDQPLEAQDQANQFLDDVRNELLQQAARGIEAQDIGLVEPVDINHENAIDHMQVDRSVVALMRREDGDVKQHLLEIMRELHSQHDGEPISGQMTGSNASAYGRILMPEIVLGEDSVYDGRGLYSHQLYPETMLTAAVGRRLGDLAAVPGEIADKVVVSATNVVQGAIFRVAPDYISVSEV